MAGRSVRWLGHSCFIISTPGGKSLVIDPFITGNPLCPVKLEDIKAATAVLVTHDHFDHTANAVDVARRTRATLIATPELTNKFRSEVGISNDQIPFGSGINYGAPFAIQGISVLMTEAFHSSPSGQPAGFIIKLEDGATIYHAGDTSIFENMRLLGELYPLDLALLPIGGVWTMDPYQAAKALSLLKPKKAIPMHYKTFPILEQSADEFVRLAKKEAPGVEVVALNPGQEYSW